MKALALLALVLLGCTISLTTGEPEDCTGGCWIASIPSPRNCKCVKPRCKGTSTADIPGYEQAVAAAAAPHTRAGGRTSFRPPARRPAILTSASDADYSTCHICKSRAFTYSSYEECMAGEQGFLPEGATVGAATAGGGAGSAALYPALQHPDKSSSPAPAVSAAAFLPVPCPPPVRAGCLDTSSFERWEDLFGSADAGSDITIPGGKRVVLHGCAQPGSAVEVQSITVAPGATLVIGDSPLRLTFYNLAVSGAFQMGTPDCPIQSGITITVPGGDEAYGIDVLTGATYDVHGQMQGPTWTRIAATVTAGSKTITLAEPVQWKAGSDILLVTTSWKDEINNQNEVLRIASVSADGRTITTRQKVQYNHYGQEYKAEVALLNRRILFTTDHTYAASALGPHTTLFTADARITGAAFEKWGARNKPGKYPIHFHLVGDTTNAFVKNNVIYNSNWRCVTLHGTNGVYVYGNVGFNIHGHCYYLEDGVEERNVLERNLGAFVHPMHTAGTTGGQSGTDRWANETLFDPTDSGASPFYALNKANTWLNNAASGGFSGFTFPRAPRAIKDFRNVKKPDGFPLNPSDRPFILFKGNTIHSTGYGWEHASCVYFGGVLYYKEDPYDSTVKLYYNNGRGFGDIPLLCPDPDWPATNDDNYRDCYGAAEHYTKDDQGNDAFLKLDDVTTALCNIGVASWGARLELNNLKAFDVTRGAEFLGQAYMSNSYIKVNTTNSKNGWSGWPLTRWENYWESFPIKGIEFYDTGVSQMLDNITFEGFRYVTYTTDPNDFWYDQTPHALRHLYFSDYFKPSKNMAETRAIKCVDCDIGSPTGEYRGAFFKVDHLFSGASFFFSVIDLDGSIVRHAQPSKPPGPYYIGSYPSWWKLSDAGWQEPLFKGTWISPLPDTPPDTFLAARLEMSIESADGARFTRRPDDGDEIVTQIGTVSQFGASSRSVPLTINEGTLGFAGNTGWWVLWNATSSAYTAPKSLNLYIQSLWRNQFVLWGSCWPRGTSFTVKKVYKYAQDCLNVDLTQAASQEDMLSGGGNSFYVDANNCLQLKITDLSAYPWTWNFVFERNGLYLEDQYHWYDTWYSVIADGPGMTAAGCDAFWCPLPGDPASRVPPAVTFVPDEPCYDEQPPDQNCAALKCGWYDQGCDSSDLESSGYCKGTCGLCGTAPVPTRSLLVKASMAVSQVQGKYKCRATVTVTDAATNAPLGKGVLVAGEWSKVPDNSPTDSWPFSASTRTSATSVATLLASKSLSKFAATTCAFSVTDVDAAALAAKKAAKAAAVATFVVDWQRSTVVAKACWDASGAFMKSC